VSPFDDSFVFLVHHGEYFNVLASHWFTMKKIPMCWPSIGPPWGIFLCAGLLLVHHGEYSYVLAFESGVAKTRLDHTLKIRHVLAV
jgi:hypothetical protein